MTGLTWAKALASAGLLTGGCVPGSETNNVSPATPPSSTPSASAAPVTVLPPPPRYPYPDFFVEEVDTAVADAIGRRFVYDALASSQSFVNVLMVRVFRDAPPDEVIIDAAAPGIAMLQDHWRDVPVDIVRCPFTTDQFDTLDTYLRSLQWRDPDKDVSIEAALHHVAPGPRLWDFHDRLDGLVHCKVQFGVRDITQSEIDRIREVALANDVLWMEFAVRGTMPPQGEVDYPRDPPDGFLPHLELPWYCTPPACTGNEPELRD